MGQCPAGSRAISRNGASSVRIHRRLTHCDESLTSCRSSWPVRRLGIAGPGGRAPGIECVSIDSWTMSIESASAEAPGTEAINTAAASMAAAPVARRIPSERTHHGDTFIDEYAWLGDKDNPETIAYLEAENAYVEAATAGQADLRTEIFGEIKARTQETDLSVPSRKGGWWYYSRTEAGKQYAMQCRREVRPGDAGPPMTPGGAALDGEEVLLDGNELAGDERYTLRIKDLASGAVLPDEIPDTYYGLAWSLDGSALFYVTVDAAWRPYRVWRHIVGTPAADDVVVFEEPDERFGVGVGLTRSERFLHIGVASKLTSEAWLLDAAQPTGEFSVVMPRRQGVEYSVEHQIGADGTDRLLILHNENAENFELSIAPLADPAASTPLIAHRADTRLLDVDAFADYLAVYYRRDGLTGLRIIRGDGTEHEIAFGEPVYEMHPGSNPEYGSDRFRLGYVSLVTPNSVYDCDMAHGELHLLRRQPVLARPDGREYDPADYEQRREWATAADGTQIPISLVCRKGAPRDGSAPCLIYGYGSYEISIDPGFSISRLSLLDRGFSFAIEHIRGGGEMGRRWYDEGKLLRKATTFTDFIACAEHLVSEGWTTASRLVARGGSAGGLLMGAVANLAPQAFGGIVAQVPFVDALTSILDPSLPLTVPEWEEWGDPLHDPEVYAYIKSYSPYENIDGQAYPPILAMTSLNDTHPAYPI